MPSVVAAENATRVWREGRDPPTPRWCIGSARDHGWVKRFRSLRCPNGRDRTVDEKVHRGPTAPFGTIGPECRKCRLVQPARSGTRAARCLIRLATPKTSPLGIVAAPKVLYRRDIDRYRPGTAPIRSRRAAPWTPAIIPAVIPTRRSGDLSRGESSVVRDATVRSCGSRPTIAARPRTSLLRPSCDPTNLSCVHGWSSHRRAIRHRSGCCMTLSPRRYSAISCLGAATGLTPRRSCLRSSSRHGKRLHNSGARNAASWTGCSDLHHASALAIQPRNSGAERPRRHTTKAGHQSDLLYSCPRRSMSPKSCSPVRRSRSTHSRWDSCSGRRERSST